MANALYKSALERFFQGQIDLLTDTINVVLVDQDDYTPDLVNHDFLDDVPVAARVATQTLANKSVAGGVFTADPVIYPTVSGDEFELVVIYKDTGNAATSPLLAVIDTATSLPATPTGNNIQVQWNSGIFG